MSEIQLLREIAERGAPAQAAEARRLLEALRVNPGDLDVCAEARHLVDAYLNDPYLERR